METQEIIIKHEQTVNRNPGQIGNKFYILLLIVIVLLTLPVIKIYARFTDPVIPVRGMVVDSVSDGISFVTIQIERNDSVIQQLASDESGKFSFIVNTPGKYNLQFHSIGYEVKKTEISIKDQDKSLDLGNVSLTPSNEQVKEITVSVLKPLVRSEAEKLIYSAESDPESSTGTILDMLRKVPLVTIDGDDNVQLRGISGVKFLINGKSSVALDRNTSEVLKNMPSNTIKDIEVITNPSSKYEAEGKAGIINIITKRKVSDGYNGSANASIRLNGSYNGNIFFTSKINKFVYSINASMNHYESRGSKIEIYRENYQSTLNRFTKINRNSDGSGNWKSINSEASYEFDSLNLVSISFNGGFSDNEGTWLSTSEDFDMNHNTTSDFEKIGLFNGDRKDYTGTLDYQKLFNRKDRSLTFSYRYSYDKSNSHYNDKYTGLINFTDYWHDIHVDGIDNEQTIQVDYVDPFSKKGQIETGFKQIWRKDNSITDRDMFDETLNDWVHSNSGSNEMIYHQSVLGAYFTFTLKLEKLTLKAGLRAENTVNRGQYKITTDTTFTNRMFNLVPFFLISKDYENGKNIKLSYTNRLARPGSWYLNPFYDDTEPKNIFTGNPKLKTEVSNNFEFFFSKFSGKFNFSVNLNTSFSNNLISQISYVLPDGAKVSTYENIGRNRLAGGTVFGSLKVTKKLKVDARFGSNYQKIDSNNNSGIKNSGWSTTEKIGMIFNPSKNSTLLANAGINGKVITLQGYSTSGIWYYITYQQDFLDKKLKLEARLQNFLGKYYTYKSKQFSSFFYEENNSRYLGRIISLSIFYSFGQMKDQVKKSNKSIRNDDLKQ